MIIGIDGNEANVEKKVGVSWYAFELLHQFKKQATARIRFRVFLRENPRADLPSENEYFKYTVVRGAFLWSQIFLPLALFLKHRNLSVFFSPAHYAPRVCPCPTVVTLHDLSYFYFPHEFLKKDLYQLERWTQYSIRNAAHVIAVSEKTKQDALSHYTIPADKISVVYNGYSMLGSKEIKPEFEIKQPYFLYIGTLQPRKNIKGLLAAFSIFIRKHTDYALCIVGKKGWLFDEIFEEVKRLKLEDKVIFTGYVEESHKKWLLKNAIALVAPGFYEGFGLPILEGWAAKTPVLASIGGALPEVGDNACIYFNPHDPYSITYAMKQVVSNKTLVKKLKVAAVKQLSRFSWEKTTAETLKILADTARRQ